MQMPTVQTCNTTHTLRLQVFGVPTTVTTGHGVKISETTYYNTAPPIDLPGNGAITSVDQTFWQTWLSQNQTLDAVQRHLIFQVG
jgi:hypothetical protein